MSLTINIYYTGENGNARKFAKEMVEFVGRLWFEFYINLLQK